MCAAVQTMKLDQKGSKRLVLRWRLASALHCSIWTSSVSGLWGRWWLVLQSRGAAVHQADSRVLVVLKRECVQTVVNQQLVNQQ